MGKIEDIESLKKLCDYHEKRDTISIYLDKFQKTNHLGFVRNLLTQHEYLALKSLFIECDTVAAKQHFYTCGKLDEYLINNHDTILLPSRLSLALLSDDEKLANRYSRLRNSLYEQTKNEEGVVFHAMQNIIKNDHIALNDNIKTIERLSKAKKNWEKKYYNFCILFFNGILEKDIDSITKALEELVEPKFHKKRVLSHTIDLVAKPDAGFSKLAWIRGFEIEIDSYLIPKELMPIKPNGKYKIEYDFLKENTV